MKKTLIATLIAGASLTLTVSANADTQMHRLYNPNSGEHFYTADINEKNSLVTAGWSYEGIGWAAPESGEPVYRVYNPNAGDHHYTKNIAEKDNLVALGWSYEGISWYSGGNVPLYRAYNPNAKAGSHNYTANPLEENNLISIGWNDEGISWYGVSDGVGNTNPNVTGPVTQKMLEAVAKARKMSKIYSRQNMIYALTQFKEFSTTEAFYGVNNAGIDWKNNALGLAEMSYFSGGQSKSEIYKLLTSTSSRYSGGFTPEEAQYAIDNIRNNLGNLVE